MPCAYAWKTCLCDASSARTLGASSHRAAVDMAMLIPNTQEGNRATRTRIALYSSSFLNLRLSFLFVAFSRDAVFRNLATIRYAFLEALKTARACWNKENPTGPSCSWLFLETPSAAILLQSAMPFSKPLRLHALAGTKKTQHQTAATTATTTTTTTSKRHRHHNRNHYK